MQVHERSKRPPRKMTGAHRRVLVRRVLVGHLLTAWSIATALGAAHAQSGDAPNAPPPWPAPSSPSTWIGLPQTRGSTLNVALDPAGVEVTPDGVVHFVLVMGTTAEGSAPSALRASLRCQTAEYRIEARYQADTGWVMAPQDLTWQPMAETPLGRLSWMIARNGACEGRTVAGSASEIVRRLRTGRVTGYE